jgi:hypothetical protein
MLARREVALDCSFECTESTLLFDQHRQEEWEFGEAVIEVPARICVGTSVLEEAVEMWLITLTKCATIRLPLLLKAAKRVAIRRISAPHRRTPPVMTPRWSCSHPLV